MSETIDWIPEQTQTGGRDARLLFNQKRTALLAGISARALADWDVRPCARDGREALYDWTEVLEELLRRRAPAESAAVSLDAARARLATEQADKIAMENAVARRELIYSSQMAELWGGSLTVFRARLLAVHQHVGTRLGPKAAAYVYELLQQSLAELANAEWVANYGKGVDEHEDKLAS